MKKKRGLLKDLENWEMHHKIGAFILIMILTILIVRLGVQIYNPNPVLLNFELHHFDYGLVLLIITTLLLLFGKKSYPIYLLLTAIAMGLILDDLWFIRSNILEPNLNELYIYNATFPSVIIFVITVILSVFLINHFKSKKNG